MKTVLKMGILLYMSSSFASYSFGQSQEKEEHQKRDKIVVPDKRTPVYSKMKAGVVAILEIIYPKAARNFAALSPQAENPVWVIDGKILFVSFSKNENKASAVFNTGGTLQYAITCLKPSQMPQDITDRIGAAYGTYAVFNVKEIISKTGLVYQVILENSYEYLTIWVNQDSIEESERVAKYA